MTAAADPSERELAEAALAPADAERRGGKSASLTSALARGPRLIGLPSGTPGVVEGRASPKREALLERALVLEGGEDSGRRLERGNESVEGAGRLPRRASEPFSRSRRRLPKSWAGREGLVA